MPIKIVFNSQDTPEKKEPQATVALQLVKTLSGNIIVKDHPYLDIVIDPTKNKIIAFPKPMVERDVYPYQEELFYDLFRKGLISEPDGEATQTFGGMESDYPATSKTDVDPLQAILFQLDKILNDVKSSELEADEYDENIEDRFTDPQEGEYTPYGKIPPYQDTPEGSQDTYNPSYSYAGYGYMY